MTRVPTENQEQAALFEWASVMKRKYPELELMYHAPNGGLRDGRTAATLQRTGVKSGVPDVCLPVPRGEFGSLYIEMKRRKGGVVSARQKIWLDRLNANGNRAVVCRGWEEARDTILDYLEGV